MAKIPWSRIQDAFEGEWVELVEYAWKPERLHPHAGRVRHHSSNRKELLEMIAASGRADNSIILYVGPSFPTALALSSGLDAAIGGM
jgi:hypothetical protein